MKRCVCFFVLALLAGVPGCKNGTMSPSGSTELRLTRAPEGRIGVELLDGPSVVRAFQVEIGLSSGSKVTLEDPQPPAGVAIDTVRIKMNGADRAVLFAGDKKGGLLPSSGILATFLPKTAGVAGATVSIVKAVVVDPNGGRIPVRLGPALTLY
jgi:hypothetical protein